MTPDFPLRGIIAIGGFAAVIAAISSGGLANATPMTACAPGEREDPFTSVCVPELAPANAVADPGPSQQELEQDVYDTPGLTSPHVGGTTAP
jgi:hypothetical protein